METLYDLIRREIDDGLLTTAKLDERFKKEALRQWETRSWNHITKASLDIKYSFSIGKERRDFRERVLQKILAEGGFKVSVTEIREALL